MSTKRRVVIEIIDNITRLAIFYGLFATAVALFAPHQFNLLRMGLVSVPFAINFFLRRISRREATLVAVHAVVPLAAAVVIPLGVYWAIWLVATILMAAQSVKYQFREEITSSVGFSVATAVSFVFLGIVVLGFDSLQVLPLYPIVLLIVLIGRQLVMRMLRMNTALETIHLSSRQPFKRVFAFDYKIMAVLTVLMISMVAVLHFMVISPAMGAVIGLYQRLITYDPPPPEHIDMYENDEEYEEDANTYVAHEEPESDLAWLWQYLQIIALGLVLLVLLPVSIFLIYQGFVNFMGRYAPDKNRNKTLEDMDGESELTLDTVSKRRKRSFFSSLFEHPVRRIYRKTVTRNIKKGVGITLSDTPTQVVERVTSEDIQALADEYAVVRYR